MRTSASGQPNLADAQDAEPVATCAILLPSRYALREGQPLWGGVQLGRLLGAGVQVRGGGWGAPSRRRTRPGTS